MVNGTRGTGGGLPVRRRLGLLLHGAAALALVPGFLLIAPASRWDDLPLLVAIGVLAVIADHGEVPLPSGVGFDALMALVLITVALAGPLPAMEVIVVPWVVNVLTGREPPVRAGALANLAGYGWQALAAALLLRLAGVEQATAASALVGLMAAGLAIYTVGWAVGPAVYGTLWMGHPLRTLVRSLLDMAPAGAAMVVLASLTVVLSGPLGVAALALFAAIAVLPQSFLTYAARTRPVARLPRHTATRRYAHAIALHLGLSRRERRHLRAVASAARRRPPTGNVVDYMHATLRDRSPASCDAQLCTEWWDGSGGPLGLQAEAIPLAARVLAVADGWSVLTAAGTRQLAHDDALAVLQEQAGARLDPGVVRAARAVVAQERVTAGERAPEPRLHHLRVPAHLRRALSSGA